MNDQEQKQNEFILNASAEKLNYESLIASKDQQIKFLLQCIAVKGEEIMKLNNKKKAK